MKKASKLRSLLFVAVLVCHLPFQANACGPNLEVDQARFLLFNPEVIQYPQLMAFQYTQRAYNNYDKQDLLVDRKLNIREWYVFAKQKPSKADIEGVQYSVSPDSFLTAYATNNWKSFGNNTFIKWLTKRRNKKALAYMAFAKKVEQNQDAQLDNVWDLEKSPTHIAQLNAYAIEAKTHLSGEKNSFLAQRYAFQMVKCSYYAYLSQERQPSTLAAREVFNGYLANNSSITAQWALIYIADMETDTLLRPTLFLKAFDQTEEKKVRAFQYLRLDELKNLAAKTQDAKLKILAKAVAAMMNPGRGLDDLKYIIDADPSNKYLPLLITREVNKLEDWIYTLEIMKFQTRGHDRDFYDNEYKEVPDYGKIARDNLVSDRQYLKTVIEFLLTAENKNIAKPEVCKLAIAHLYSMNGNYALAKTQLNGLDLKIDSAFKKQFHIENIITLSNLENLEKEITKNLIAQNLAQLELLNYKKANDTLNYWARDQTIPNSSNLYLYLSRKFHAVGDELTAGLLHISGATFSNEYGYHNADTTGYSPIYYLDKYGKPSDAAAMLAFKHKRNKSAFEQMITPQVFGSDDMYRDLEGTLLIREMKFEEALAVFKKMPADFWEKNYEFKNYLPLNSITDLSTLFPGESSSGMSYSKSSKKLITQEIVAIQQKIANSKNKDTAALYTFYLGNALFNSSYAGQGWMLTAYGQTAREPYLPSDYDDYDWAYYYMYPSKTNHVENYYGVASASKTYERALKLASSNKEIATKCIIMLAQCAKINYEYELLRKDPETRWKKKGYQFDNPYLALLSKYNGTKAYEEAAAQCPDIDNYLNK